MLRAAVAGARAHPAPVLDPPLHAPVPSNQQRDVVRSSWAAALTGEATAPVPWRESMSCRCTTTDRLCRLMCMVASSSAASRQAPATVPGGRALAPLVPKTERR
jgi:hypothetical protein